MSEDVAQTRHHTFLIVFKAWALMSGATEAETFQHCIRDDEKKKDIFPAKFQIKL